MGFLRGLGMKLTQVRQVGTKVLGGVQSVGQKAAGFAAKAAPALASINPELGVAAAAASKIAEGIAQTAGAIKSGQVGQAFSQGANMLR
jgi:hypothetical protein